MTPERWRQVERLYHAALELAEHERGAFLAQACGADEDLRREVESLLAAHDRAGSFIAENAVADHAQRLAAQPSAEDQPTAMLPNLLTDSSPRTINQYRIVSLLGKGGMGEVWLAEDTRLKRKVALKLLPAEFTNDAERLRRFEQEALAISALNHPNIITIHEIGESDAGRFIVMELVAGRTLRAIAAEPVVAPDDLIASLIAWGSQLAKALHAAHTAGITHRDIKPENIMVRDDGYVKVLDFGLARLTAHREDVAQADSLSGTQPGMLLGTVKYMSPEQARGEKVTSAADIFALGIVLYELATGAHPFNSATLLGTLQQITSETPIAPARLNPGLPAALNALILRMLAKEASTRPPAAEVERALAELTGHRGSGPLDRPAKPALPRHTVGREKERAELRSGFASALNGRGSLLCVAGEPGIGKTTLVEDFLAELAAEGQCTIARGRCSERLAGTEAYLPLLEALESLLQGGSNPAIARVLKQIAPTWYAQVAPLSGSDEESARLLAEVKAASQERMKRELASFLSAVAQAQPLVLFFDDLHWADVSTIDLLNFLAGKFDTMHVLIVTTYRPSDMLLSKHPFLQIKPDLQARGVCRELLLGFLQETEIAEYLALEFPGNRFPIEFPQLIHAKTEGSPLFMADLVRYLRYRGVIANTSGAWVLAQTLPDIEHELPESVRGMIERKIAQLGEEDRKLLTAASVQGFEFDSAVVAQVLSLEADEVEERLETLERVFAFVKLTSETEFPNHALTLRYRFIHILYQSALYASLRATRKATLSREVAQTLEGFYGEKRASVANELAALYEAGREFAQAADYFRLAAEQAGRVFATQEAVTLARRGLALLPALPEGRERNEQELALQVGLGNALMATKGFAAPEVGQTYTRARELCEQLSESSYLAPVLFGLFMFQNVRANYAEALELGKVFLDLTVSRNDPARLVAPRMIGFSLLFLGEFQQARAQFEQIALLYDPAQHRSLTWLFGGDVGTLGRSFQAITLWLLGYPEQARTLSQEALRLGREVSHAQSQALAMYWAALIHQFRREWQPALKLAEAMVELATEQGLPVWLALGTWVRGWAMTGQGKIAAGIDELRRGLDAYQATGAKAGLSLNYCELAEAYAKAAQPRAGFAALEAVRAQVEQKDERCWEAEVWRLRGELLLLDGAAAAEAEQCFHQAIETARRQSAKSLELRAVISLARLWQQQGKRAEARQMLAEIYGWFTEGFDTADLKEAKVLLDELA
ncbi:MAG: protein kinase domain-containing protein [Blastocatellia bacterium]